jgi:hypothetical protein
MICTGNTTPWYDGITYLANNPITILLPAGTITIPTTWIVPSNTRLIGIEPSTIASASSGTVILAKSGFASGAPMIQLGDSRCPHTPCAGISVEGVVLDGNSQNVIGVQNSSAQDGSYVDHVALFQIMGTGLLVSGSAQNSGPYSNITFDTNGSTAPSGSCAQIKNVSGATRGLHGITCISHTQAGNAISLDSSNNSIEDVRIVGWDTGVMVGSQGAASSNVLLNITGDTAGTSLEPVYVVQVSKLNTVSDLAIVGVSTAITNSYTYTLYDQLTSSSPTITTPVGLYVLGDSSGGGYSRFTTVPSVATWAVGAGVPPPSSACASGSLFTNTTGGHLYVCEGSPTLNWQLVK